MSLRYSCIMFLALGFATPAAAQEAPRDADQEIVVTGEALERRIRDFVGALTQAPPRGQLSRFEWEACPIAIGLTGAQKAAVVGRMRQVAEAAKIPLGGTGCRPNVLVAVARDKRAFIEALSRTVPRVFADMSRGERRRILSEPHASAWQGQGPPLDADGRTLEQVRLVDPATGAITSDPVYMNRTIRPGTRITAPSRVHFSLAVVVVEAGALDGLTTTQLADYAAMRAFAKTDPAKLPPSPPPTILTVLDVPMGGAVPITLTEWDLGFLRGLYESQANLYGAAQRSEIRRKLETSLGEAEGRQD
ncbi:MAG TPA: hypothetical protein VF782_10960 [Allosphingosinicella sp.]